MSHAPSGKREKKKDRRYDAGRQKKRSVHPLHLSISRICQDLNARGDEKGTE